MWLHLVAEDSPHLIDRPSTTLGRELRISCRRSLKLTDELTRRLHLQLHNEGDLPPHSDSKPSASVAAALIRRHEGLVELGLRGGEATVIRALSLSGTKGQQLRVLLLTDAACCTLAVGHAVQHLCPRIQMLELEGTWLDPAFFLPLRDLRSLVQITMGGFSEDCWDGECAAVVRVLATLHHLKHLSFSSISGWAEPADVALLAALTNLEDLRLHGLAVYMAEADAPALGRALGSLTQLTALEFPQWQAKAAGGPDDLTGVIETVVAQLGGLQRLAVLADVSDAASCAVLQHGCAALCQLSALTKLSFPGWVAHDALGAGHLPRLRHLDLTGATDCRVLGGTLRPLWPLPELRCVTFTVDLSIPLDAAPDVHGDPVGHAIEVMWQGAQMLRQAPRLNCVVLTLGLYQDQLVAPLLGIANAVLLPLRDVLTELNLQNLPAGTLEALWPALCLAGRLETLCISRCEVSERGLASVAQHLTALRHLAVWVYLGDPEVEGHKALAVAAVRVQPLRVSWYPALDSQLSRLFRAAALVGGAVLVVPAPWRD